MVIVFSPLYDFLNTFFSLAYCMVRIQYIIQVTYKIRVTLLFMLSVRLRSPAGHLLLVKIWVSGSQKSYLDFQL